MTARSAKALTVVALGWFSVGTTSPAAGVQDVGLPVGSQAPAAVLEDLAGEPVDLAQYIGQRPLLIEFWASWCTVCEALAPRLRQAYERFGTEVHFLVVAVAVNQTKRRVQRHVEEHDMPYQFLWDGQGRATRSYKVPTTAHVVIVDSKGKIAYTGVGADQDLEGALAALQGAQVRRGPGTTSKGPVSVGPFDVNHSQYSSSTPPWVHRWGDLVDRFAQLGVGGRIQLTKRRGHIRYPALRIDHEQGPIIQWA